MNRVLVSGATGHLGQAVIRQLAARGIPTCALGRRPDALARLMEQVASPHLVTAVVDLTQPETINAAISKFGPFRQLIHLAAQIDGASLEAQLSGNLLTMIALVGALRENLEQIVNVSSMEVYGAPRTYPISEAHPTAPDSYYGASKLASEKFLQVFALERKAVVTHLRCSSIYGPGETIRRASTVFLRNAIEGKSLRIAGDGSDLRDYIYVEDAADAVLKSLEEKRPGVFNLGGGEPLSIKSMAEMVIRISGKSLPLEYGDRTKPKYDLALDIAKIGAEIGFKPQTTMEQGLAAEYQSFLRA